MVVLLFWRKMFDHRIPYSKSRSNGKIFKRILKGYRKRDYEVLYGRTDACAGDSGSMLPDVEGKKSKHKITS